MSAINQAERNRRIVYFVNSYIALIGLCAWLFYWQFVATPRLYARQTGLANEKVMELVGYTHDADSLVVRIQKTKQFKPEALVPFYQWINDLRAVYKQPFYATILTSYAEAINEVAASKGKDTLLPSLKAQLTTLQKNSFELMQLNQSLLQQLETRKRAATK
ncbi:MAG: hypothetical protein KKG00_12130 [Bacteroidetes bacterium]|nr:hypothetical protein [Bacteroidota bacterium]